MGLPTPNTRKEQYLNAIATGNASGLPTPITREEEYLNAIAKGGGSGDGDMKKSVYDSDLDVANAGGIGAFVGDAISGKVDKVEGKGLSTNDYDNTEKGKVADNAEAIEATQDMISDAYDPTHTYNVGDYCIHEDVLYKCNTASTTGTWDSSKWDAVTIAGEFGGVAADVKWLKDKTFVTIQPSSSFSYNVNTNGFFVAINRQDDAGAIYYASGNSVTRIAGSNVVDQMISINDSIVTITNDVSWRIHATVF